jgi:Multidrug resistance efflux pump
MKAASPEYRLRSDLEFSSQQHLGRNYVVVKDPVTKRYFRFTENQKVILDFLSEPKDVSRLINDVSEKLHAVVSESSIEGFLKSLEDKLLLDTEQVREKLGTYSAQKLQDRNLLYWKLASLNPERIFDWLVPRTRWAFTIWFQIAAVILIASGVLMNYLHWEELTVDVYTLFNLNGLFLVWIVTLGVVTLHEFAHGITCCHFGGKVQEIGFMLIYFQPAFYCDVSDSWMFPSKRSRMWVTFAGGYFQLVVWSICTLLWRVTDTDTTINQLALVVIVFAGVQTLFNFNPLIKLDGYYLLSDYLEIPNLRSKAIQTLWNRVAGTDSKVPRREERAQLIYGTAAILFSTIFLVYVYRALYTWATSNYAFAGLVGFLMFSTLTLRRTAVESVAGIRSVLTRAAYRKYRNGGIVVAALLIMFVGRWDLKIPAEFRVVARDERTVRAETGGMIVEILVQEGSRVAKGDVLARLRDFQKDERISELNGELAKNRNALKVLRDGARAEDIERQRKEVAAKRTALDNARRIDEQRNQLIETIEQKRSQLKLDQQALERGRDLSKAGLIARAELDKLETAVEISERELRAAEAALRALTETSEKDIALKGQELAVAEAVLKSMLAGSRPEEILQAKAEVDKLEDQIRILKEQLAKTEIRSPIDGIVSTPYLERKLNENLAAGQELCRIIDYTRVSLEMQVPQKEMADVGHGFPVSMTPSSFPSMNLEGRVDFIAPVAQTVNGQQMVVVKSEIPNDEMLLKPDMTGFAHIHVGSRRIVDVMTRRLVRWIRTEFWYILP